jgi:hypothetical protein
VTLGRGIDARGGEELDALRPVLPGPPTVARAFLPTEQLALMAEMYDAWGDLGTVDIETTIEDASAHEVLKRHSQWSREVVRRRADAYRWTKTLALTGLPPGRYLLRVRAVSRVHLEHSTSREGPCEIHGVNGDGAR